MNKARLKKIKKVAEEIEKIAGELSVANDELRDLLYEEEDYHDNMPENLQYSYQGERSEEAIDIMNDATEKLDEILQRIEQAADEIFDVVINIEDIE